MPEKVSSPFGRQARLPGNLLIYFSAILIRDKFACTTHNVLWYGVDR